MSGMACDTCGSIGPTKQFGSWGLCEICAKFAERGDQDGLALRSLFEFERLQVTTELPSGELLAMIRDIHLDLWKEVA